jgi:hypothetical protein
MVKLEQVPRVIWQVENGYKIKNKKQKNKYKPWLLYLFI